MSTRGLWEGGVWAMRLHEASSHDRGAHSLARPLEWGLISCRAAPGNSEDMMA